MGVIKSTENFTPDIKKISKWWNNPKHALKKDWYVDTYTKDQRISFRDKLFKDMKRFKTEIEFFKWFECSGQIDETNSSLQVLINKWHTKDKVVKSITPPLEDIHIPYTNEVLKGVLFKKHSERDNNPIIVADMNKVLKENNYTNQVLHLLLKR